MTLSRAAVETFATIRTRVRDECEDPTTDPATNTIPTAGLEFSDTQYGRAINDELKFLAVRAGLQFPGELLIVTTLTYSETEPQGAAIPSAITGAPIIQVEVIDGTAARQVFWAPPEEIEHYVSNVQSSARPSDRLFYTLQADSSDVAVQRIRIRPNPGALQFRIWTLAAPVISSPITDADTPLLSSRWGDLIALGAALRLLRRSGRATIGEGSQTAAYNAWLALFDQEAVRRHEGDRIRFPAGRHF